MHRQVSPLQTRGVRPAASSRVVLLDVKVDPISAEPLPFEALGACSVQVLRALRVDMPLLRLLAEDLRELPLARCPDGGSVRRVLLLP